MPSRKRRKGHDSNSGCLILLICFVILLIVFIAEYPNIRATLEKTKFFDIVKQRTEVPKATETPGSPVPGSQPNQTQPVAPLQGEPQGVPSTTVTTQGGAGQPGQGQPSSVQIAPSTTTSLPTSTVQPVSPEKQTDGTQQELRKVSLFFMKIEDDSTISSHEVKRMVPASDAPLSDAIKALLSGPTEGEIRSKLVSLIPKGTTLRGVNMRGSTAIIDLSEAFMYSKYGIEGYTAQLKQIVYTATAFPSVQDVQILVEGKVKDYLGGEGVYTGKPLSRNSF